MAIEGPQLKIAGLRAVDALFYWLAAILLERPRVKVAGGVEILQRFPRIRRLRRAVGAG
jgi:hypothetical protein